MLEIKFEHRYYITLNGECIHGGIYSKEQALVYLRDYQKIWDAGYNWAKEETE